MGASRALPTLEEVEGLGRRERAAFALRCGRHAVALLGGSAEAVKLACGAALSRAEVLSGESPPDVAGLEAVRAQLEHTVRRASAMLSIRQVDAVEAARAGVEAAIFAARAETAGGEEARRRAAERAGDAACADAAAGAAEALAAASGGGGAAAGLVRALFEAVRGGRRAG